MKIKPSLKLVGYIACGIICLGTLCSFYIITKNSASPDNEEAPKIVNIVNFIRLLEPTDSNITEDVLYQTVVRQVGIMKKYKLGGTFLLQYDALQRVRIENPSAIKHHNTRSFRHR